jgi:hypothetical protein
MELPCLSAITLGFTRTFLAQARSSCDLKRAGQYRALPRSVLFEFRAVHVPHDRLSPRALRSFSGLFAVDFLVKITGIVNDAFTRLDAAHEFRKVRIINLQSVTNESSCARIDGPVLNERLRPTPDSIADCVVCD